MIRSFSDVAGQANPLRWYERTTVQILVGLSLMIGGFFAAISLQDRGAALLNVDPDAATALFYGARRLFLACSFLALVAVLSFLWINFRRGGRNVDAYTAYLSSLPRDQVQWAAISPEVDPAARATAANYLNRAYPGWSSFLAPAV